MHGWSPAIVRASRAVCDLTLALAAAGSVVLSSGCSGEIDSTPQSPRGELTDSVMQPPVNGDVGGPQQPGAIPANTDDACAIPYAAPRAVLLTPRQYVNVLKDVVGPDAVTKEDATSDDKLEFDTVDLPRMTTASFDHALRLSDRAIDSLRGKSARWLGCNNASDAACVRTKLGGVARRAYKRAVTGDELDELMKLYDLGRTESAGDADAGVLVAVQAILLSPSTLYRTEFTGTKSANLRELSLHERAAALAALLLDGVPDEPLLAAADDGSLRDPKLLEQQIDRLLALPRVRAHVTRVVLSAFKIPKLFETPKDERAFPEYTPALQNSMYEETRRFVESVLWQNKPLSELLTSRQSFVDAPLAKLYGVPYAGRGTDFVSVELPEERSGLLTQASVLAVLSRTEKTSVVARGLFVRGNVLCLPKVASPPMSIQAQIEEQLEANSSERELAAYRGVTSPCKGCHAGFDAFGLLLEDFDAIGRYSQKPATPVDFKGLGGITGSLSAPTMLTKAKAEAGEFTSCFARRTVGYALSVASEPLRDSCDRDALTKDVIARGGTLRDLIIAIASSPHFAQRAEEP